MENIIIKEAIFIKCLQRKIQKVSNKMTEKAFMYLLFYVAAALCINLIARAANCIWLESDT